MPPVFSGDRAGFVERWIIARHLAASPESREVEGKESRGDHRMGRRAFVSVGCAACHFLPDAERAEQPDLGRFELVGLSDRFSAESLAAFLDWWKANADAVSRRDTLDLRTRILRLDPSAFDDPEGYWSQWVEGIETFG